MAVVPNPPAMGAICFRQTLRRPLRKRGGSPAQTYDPVTFFLQNLTVKFAGSRPVGPAPTSAAVDPMLLAGGHKSQPIWADHNPRAQKKARAWRASGSCWRRSSP